MRTMKYNFNICIPEGAEAGDIIGVEMKEKGNSQYYIETEFKPSGANTKVVYDPFTPDASIIRPVVEKRIYVNGVGVTKKEARKLIAIVLGIGSIFTLINLIF